MRIQSSKLKVQNLGFTLIELLVVISIIGILASLAMVSYSGAQKQTRDTQRKSDLNQYRNGLETYAASHNSMYPSRKGTGLYGGASADRFMCPNDLEPKFVASCPSDPLDTNEYQYVYHSDGSGGGSDDANNYILFVGLETGGAWVVCSNGQSFKKDTHPAGDTDCGF